MSTEVNGHGKTRTADRALGGEQGAGQRREPLDVVDAINVHLLFADGLLEPLENIDQVGFSDHAVISLTVQARARIREARQVVEMWSKQQGSMTAIGPA